MVEFVAASYERRPKSDALVLSHFQGEKPPVEIVKTAGIDASGKNGEMITLYPEREKELRWIILGLGKREEFDDEQARRAFGALSKTCQSKGIDTLSILPPKECSYRAVAEGLLLPNYSFDRYRKKKSEDVKKRLVKAIFLDIKDVKNLNDLNAIFDGVYLARDLINTCANELTPQELVKEAKKLSKKHSSLKVTVFDKKRIEKEKMGLLLAVNQGSLHDPAFITLEYKGDPKSKQTHLLVGKGITYDTGGINLKPASGGSLEIMKKDMAGSAVVLGVMQALCALKAKINVVALIPSTENSIGSGSYRPGDVFTAYDGTTVEIGNTDAEGRLVLADAIAYGIKTYKPKEVVNIATLTGAIIIALGNEACGLFSNDDALAQKLHLAGESTCERAWRFPLYEDYAGQLKSDVADTSNIGGREAGSITAAYFLKKFVNKTPWAHLDIAGVSWDKEGRRYFPKHATGFGVRLLVEYLTHA